MNDLNLALRRLLRAPGFTLTALATLALCLGANLTIFAVVDAVLLRPLPFPEPQRLVTVFNGYPRAGLERDGASLYNYYDRRGRIAAFSSLSELRYATALIGDGAAARREDVLRVTPEFFATLGVGPRLGRAFGEDEMTPGRDDSVVISDAYWRARFGHDPRILGQGLEIDGARRTIVGVLPPGFRFLSSAAQVVLPLASSAEERGLRQLHVGGNEMIARLAPGATLAAAQKQVDARNAVQERDDPWARQVAEAGFHSTVAPLRADHVASIRPTLILLQAGGLLLVLIGAVNLLNLLLIRAGARAKEQGIRQALGARALHVLRQAMAETVLLAAAGGAASIMVAIAGVRLLAMLGIGRLPMGAGIDVDLRVALVAMLAAVLAGVLLALPIAWLNRPGHLGDALRSEARGGTSGHATQRARHAFIVAQIALAFVLLAGAGLLGQSLKRAMAVSPGFHPANVLAGQVTLPASRYGSNALRLDFIERAEQTLAQQPGVRAAGASTALPVQGTGSATDNNAMTVEGYQRPAGTSPILHYRYGVAGDYFSAMGIPLRAGRYLRSSDSHSQQRVCVVDEDFARRYWPDGSALGKRLFEGPDRQSEDQAFTVVGVVGAVKQTDLTDPNANGAIYFPYRYLAKSRIFVVSRTAQAPDAFAPSLRHAVRDADPALAVDAVQSMRTRIADTLVARRSPALLAGIFAVVALLLAAIGTYGVIGYAVAQRRREIAMRMALGAPPARIGRHFLGLGLRLLAVGTLLGTFGAWLAGTAMQGFLYKVPALDFGALLGSAAVLGLAAVLACVLPARRAARVAPTAVLGEE